MAGKKFDKDRALIEVAAIEEALRAGFAPHGDARKGTPSAIAEAARVLGLSRTTLSSRIFTEYPRHGVTVDWSIRSDKERARKGELGFKPVIPGFEITQISSGPRGDFVQQKQERGPRFEMPKGQQLKEVSALVGGDGRTILQWTKTEKNKPDPMALVAAIKAGFANFAGFAPPQPPPAAVDDGSLTLIPLADLHMGMYAWAGSTGKSWDLPTCKREYRSALDELFGMMAPRSKAIILGGGDATHADNRKNQTPNSGHLLDVDGRHEKVLLETCKLFVYIIDRALFLHNDVLVRLLKGNHDEETCIAITYFLLAWYRHEPRVTIDADASRFWFHRFGKVFLAATHGDKAKPAELPKLMAVDRPQDWAAAPHRYGHCFHVHHQSKIEDEIMGVPVVTHRAPCPRDEWHHSEGFRSGRAFSASYYSGELGFRGSSYVTLGA